MRLSRALGKQLLGSVVVKGLTRGASPERCFRCLLATPRAVLLPLLSLLLRFLGVLPAFIFTPDRLKSIARAPQTEERGVLNCLPTACRNRTDAQKGERKEPARGRAGPDHPAVSRRVEGAPTYFSDRIETRTAAEFDKSDLAGKKLPRPRPVDALR